jgi:hypothetical protein
MSTAPPVGTGTGVGFGVGTGAGAGVGTVPLFGMISIPLIYTLYNKHMMR